MAFAHLFANGSAQAQAYATFRPRYPEALFVTIFKYMGLADGAKGSLVVDVATGSGQALEGLAHRFERGVGVDVSTEQLQKATKFDNVEYRQGDAHHLPVQDGSADLITVAQALHWFERPPLYRAAARAVRSPSGVLAVWTYDAGHVAPVGGAVDRVYQDMWSGVLGPYWAAPRKLVDDLYQDIEPMAPEFFAHQERHQFTTVTETSVDALVGYVGSFSAYATYKKQHPDLPDPLVSFRQRLEVAHTAQGSGALELIRMFTLIQAKGPKVEQ